ncbi:hypothetical protein [Acinetobacter sp. ETR1]|uniref:hypothetical protein n=1 Tax=Acinetobacter sp. ETR1 TaxID=1485002 RepID=UPI0004DA08B7|nr:hypothetical protein [Acinetobacter sp. ETR1]KEC85396.1 hypothetical protein DT74_21955 [Acinetobacter sp. ETR1]
MFEKNTINQHFISVAEQTLNQCNPEVTKRTKRKINSFDVIDRETFHIALSNNSTPKAIDNLSYMDLFTFGTFSDGNRLCFENLFNRLEKDLITHTNLLLNKEGNEYENFIYVFKSKLLNMIRNPFCIIKTINNFGDISGYFPVDQSLKEYYDLIDSFTIPIKILNDFEINEDQYRKWLKIIFLMITPLKDDKYILDILVENYFNYKNFYHIVNIYTFNESACLLSDRSYIDLSPLFKDTDGISFGFNLRKDAFIYICIFKNDIEFLVKKLLNANNNVLERVRYLKTRGLNQLQYGLEIGRCNNEIEILMNFNRQVIYQCKNNVYAATSDIKK